MWMLKGSVCFLHGSWHGDWPSGRSYCRLCRRSSWSDSRISQCTVLGPKGFECLLEKYTSLMSILLSKTLFDHSWVLDTWTVHIGLVHFHSPHSVADLVTGGARILKSIWVMLTLNMISHILPTSMSKLVTQVAGPACHLTLLLFTKVQQVFRRVQFACRRWFNQCSCRRKFSWSNSRLFTPWYHDVHVTCVCSRHSWSWTIWCNTDRCSL